MFITGLKYTVEPSWSQQAIGAVRYTEPIVEDGHECTQNAYKISLLY